MNNSLTIGKINLIRAACKKAWYEAIGQDTNFCTLPAYIMIEEYLKSVIER